jgi:hypothetical protein
MSHLSRRFTIFIKLNNESHNLKNKKEIKEMEAMITPSGPSFGPFPYYEALK